MGLKMGNKKCLLCKSDKTKFKFTFDGVDIYLNKLGVADFKLNWYECDSCGVYFSEQYENIEKVYEDETLYDAAYDENEIKIRYEKICAETTGEALWEKMSEMWFRFNDPQKCKRGVFRLFWLSKMPAHRKSIRTGAQANAK